MQTKPQLIKHVEDLPAGSLLYCPELGDGVLCISANYDGHQGRSSMIIPLAGKDGCSFALQTFRVENLSQQVVVVEGVRAEVDLSTATNFEHAVAYLAKDGTYIRLRSERPMIRMHQCLRLEDGVICHSPPFSSIGFTRWWIASENDPSEVLWDSKIIEKSESKEALNG
jgi:hypothetical protein